MTAIVFPGQGSQYILMSKDFYDNFTIARDIFDKISNTVNIDLKDIIFNSNSDFLNQTKFTQLSIFCASISIFEVLKNELNINKLKIKYMMGHSLGEYTALTAAGFLSIEDCSLLLKKRGVLMHDAFEPNKSGMAAIIGIDCSLAENIINNNNLNIEIANDNSPVQIVISGIKEDLINSEIFFKQAGAKKFIALNVSSAFHSKLMKVAEDKMKNYIINSNFLDSSLFIISNYNAKISNNKKDIINNLCNQISNRVRWVESVKTLENTQEKNVIEIGPGKVLTGLIKRISGEFNIFNIEKISDIEKIKNEF